jgi:hypothetical protein
LKTRFPRHSAAVSNRRRDRARFFDVKPTLANTSSVFTTTGAVKEVIGKVTDRASGLFCTSRKLDLTAGG